MNPIPYTSSAFDMIAKHSRCFHNNQEIPSDKMKFHVTNMNTNMMSQDSSGEFMQSLVSQIDMFIQTILYDVDIKQKTRDYVCVLINKYGNFLNKNSIKYVVQLDYKYMHYLGQNFIQDLFAQYTYDNVMINE